MYGEDVVGECGVGFVGDWFFAGVVPCGVVVVDEGHVFEAAFEHEGLPVLVAYL